MRPHKEWRGEGEKKKSERANRTCNAAPIISDTNQFAPREKVIEEEFVKGTSNIAPIINATN